MYMQEIVETCDDDYLIFARKARGAIIRANREIGAGTGGFPSRTDEKTGIRLVLGQAEDGPAWYCPEIQPILMPFLLEEAKRRGL